MIRLEGVSRSYDKIFVIDKLDLIIPDAGITTFLGPSGCGKSTLLRLIVGLENPEAGRVISPITKFSMLFEDDALLPWFNVEENISLVCKERERIRRALEQVGLSDYRRASLEDLSGGMKRRVAIARALASYQECLVLDEPTIRLDDTLARRIMEHICESWKGKPVIMITHDQTIAQEFSDLIYRVEGPPLQLIS